MPRLIWVFTGRIDHFAGFAMLRLKWFQWIPVGREVQLAALQTEIYYVLLYLIMLFWNIWHVKIFLKWPNIYVKYGLGWQWPMLHNIFTVFEWANIWGVKIITENVYCKVQNSYKIIFYLMTRTLFFWWTKTKRYWSSCPFPYKGSKTSAGYYHFKEVCDGEIIFCYCFLIRHT